MSNRNSKVVTNNGNSNNAEAKKAGIGQRIKALNWKKIGKAAGKVIVGGCALIGAAGVGSYAADQISERKHSAAVPEKPLENTEI